MWYFTDKTFLDNYAWAKVELSDQEFNHLIALFNNPENVQRAKIFDGNTEEEHLNSIRRSDVVWIGPELAEKNDMMEIVYKVWDTARMLNDQFFQFDLTHAEYLQLTRYQSSEGGFYKHHLDIAAEEWIECRKLSVAIQLSHPNEYEGGDFHFGTMGNLFEAEPHLKERGTMIAFPSYCQHAVMPVTRGVRHSLVGWLRGPKFK